jgi:hypothetical protein
MKTVLLSFDIEEFDMPIEYGRHIALAEQISISYEGTKVILDLLKEHSIQATFFSTVVFAEHATDLINRITTEGHELASHSYFHSEFEMKHMEESRAPLERLSGSSVRGFRMPRMRDVSAIDIRGAGYQYNSSLNPVFLPGRYNNFFRPRTVFKEDGLIQLPASATPGFRIPLFWISFHNFPMWFYRTACATTISKDHYLNLYFHPWEFTNLYLEKLGMPNYIARNSGLQMEQRFHSLISWMKHKGYRFSTIGDFLKDPENTKR